MVNLFKNNRLVLTNIVIFTVDWCVYGVAFKGMSTVGIDAWAAIFDTGLDADLFQYAPHQVNVTQPDLFEYGSFSWRCHVLIKKYLVLYGQTE